MLPPAPVPPPPSVVVGATIVKRFPGYGVHRGTVAEIDGSNDDDAPMREKLIKWKLSGCTVAVTLVMVPDP